jgi:hypothetical protein
MMREGEKVQKETRTFRTMTSDPSVLHNWVLAHRVTHIAMESKEIYWKPALNLLKGSFEVLLVNASNIKAIPGKERYQRL